MKLRRVGFVGWRGMVGSVLLQRMIEENDFSLIDEPVFFTTSQIGQPGPDIGTHSGLTGAGPAGASTAAPGTNPSNTLQDASDLDALRTLDVIVTCQGGDYTEKTHKALRSSGWQGYWIDAASTLRMDPQAVIVLDPVNMPVIQAGLSSGRKDFIGGNCTVSLMLMALDGLLNEDLVEWMTVMTYQAISGGGARQMRELIEQMGHIHGVSEKLLERQDTPILDLDKSVIDSMRGNELPMDEIGFPLAGNLLPWIDKDLDSGTSREEWKGSVETNKILGKDGQPIPIESTCVRVGTMRCHSQAFTIKLKENIELERIESILHNANEWVKVIPNQREASLTQLTPAHITGTLDIPIGRIRKLHMGDRYISAFTVGDQLLWGAAEPLRRMLRILSEFNS